ncbi:hypothetical protein NHX12_021574 [Muraenolepis orangiensis]|uniref:A to I editase domain-containing protein n=1 Tax=Muraenolepis orangiensis TaxID=630683 RepID=A0A9Q0IUH8_9TELE|nr:hypothetical protein NHX12_021574 [Muraenolepis orangiensis]
MPRQLQGLITKSHRDCACRVQGSGQLGLGVAPGGEEEVGRLMYSEAKMAALPYQAVKQQWVRSLQDSGLGTWVKKPPEQDHFLS